MRALLTFLRPLGLAAALIIAALSLSRAVLVGWQIDRVRDAGTLGVTFVEGIRFDLMMVGLILLVPVLLMPVLATSRRMLTVWRPLLASYFPACFGAAVFLEVTTMPFIDQFDARPNRLFFEYLKYPKELAGTLQAAYLPELTGGLLIVAAAIWLARRMLRSELDRTVPVPWGVTLAATPLLMLACLLAMRGTFDHRALNPSTAARSSDPMVNDLALNSSYSVLYALAEELSEPVGERLYAQMPADEVIDEVRAAMAIPDGDFISDELPTLHRQTATRTYERPKNLVIILEESLGAEFVGALGGLPLTPNLDALAEQGLWFRNLYATGIRSVRGIEAVITGFTPTPATSTVKLGRSQRDFFTIAELLRRHGYATSFIYGGESHFDNMRRFFMNNGFDYVIDENDFDDAAFFGSWGASDEDLFRHAHQEFMRLGNQPFFSLVFTTSNHTPYEFPDGRIDLYDEEKATVNNAVKYADYALGQFFETARNSPYWNDTVFLIVADHNSRVYGPDLVPVHHFHIPALVLGADIAPAVFSPVASQLDLPPTLLSLIGISETHPMIGHDLTRPEFASARGRAIMQYATTQAFMEDDRIVVLRKNLPPAQLIYDGAHLVDSATTDEALVHKALAHANWSSLAYDRQLFRLP